MNFRREQHLIDDDGGPVDTQHSGHGETPDIGVDHGHLAATGCERDGQIRRQRGLADAALTGRNEQAAGAVGGIREGDRPALAVAVGRLAAAGGRRIADHELTNLGPLLVGHDRKVERDRRDAIEFGHRGGNPSLDLVAQRATGDGEGDLHRHRRALDVHPLHHAEVNDAAVQLGIFDGAQRVDDGALGHGHERGS